MVWICFFAHSIHGHTDQAPDKVALRPPQTLAPHPTTATHFAIRLHLKCLSDVAFVLKPGSSAEGKDLGRGHPDALDSWSPLSPPRDFDGVANARAKPYILRYRTFRNQLEHGVGCGVAAACHCMASLNLLQKTLVCFRLQFSCFAAGGHGDSHQKTLS